MLSECDMCSVLGLLHPKSDTLRRAIEWSIGNWRHRIARCRDHSTCSDAFARASIADLMESGSLDHASTIISIVSGLCTANPSNWRFTCDHERMLGGCTGLAVRGGLGVWMPMIPRGRVATCQDVFRQIQHLATHMRLRHAFQQLQNRLISLSQITLPMNPPDILLLTLSDRKAPFQEQYAAGYETQVLWVGYGPDAPY